MTLTSQQRRWMLRAAAAPAMFGAKLGGRLAVDGVRLGIRTTQTFPPLPDLPVGGVVELPEGSTFVIDTGEPHPGAPTIVLLHGLVTTAYLNWFGVLEELAATHRVITLDQRWHGRGIVSERFSLEDCVDDTVAVLDQLGVERAIVAGYSMGGALAQVMWQRHPQRCAALLLCSTASYWQGTAGDRAFYPWLHRFNNRFAARHHERVTQHAEQLAPVPKRRRQLSEFAWGEFRATSAWAIPEVLGALGAFDAREWMESVDVPVGVVITGKDRAIPTARQREMAASIPGATAHESPGGHASIVFDSARWKPVFLAAVAEVTAAAGAAVSPAGR